MPRCLDSTHCLALESAEPSGLFAFLGQDRAEKGHVGHLVAAVGGENHLHGGDGAEGDVG